MSQPENPFNMLAMNGKLGKRLLYLVPVAATRLSCNSNDIPVGPPASGILLRSKLGSLHNGSVRGHLYQVCKALHHPFLVAHLCPQVRAIICSTPQRGFHNAAGHIEDQRTVRKAVQHTAGRKIQRKNPRHIKTAPKTWQ